MTPVQLLGALAGRGAKFSVQAGELVVDAPRGTLTSEDRAALAAHKPELVALLSTGAMPPWPPRPSELADWPLSWRERWGRRANELAEAGIPFPADERRAFIEVK